MGRPSNESKEIDALVEKGMSREEAEALSAEDRAILLEGQKTNERTVEQADAEHNATLAEVERLREELAAQAAKAEQELAAARAEATNAAAENDRLKEQLVFAGSEFEGERAQRPAGEIRVKTPMLINPVVPNDYDPSRDGPIPPAYPLNKGLNVDVPAWVVNTWHVQNNLEAE